MFNTEATLTAIHALTHLGLWAGWLLPWVLLTITMLDHTWKSSRIAPNVHRNIVRTLGVLTYVAWLFEGAFMEALYLDAHDELTWANFVAQGQVQSLAWAEVLLALGIVGLICYAIYRAYRATLGAKTQQRA